MPPLGAGSPPSPPRTVPEQIADALGTRIVDGGIPPGQRLTEQEVAAQFDVSRAPAREALRLLERRGLIEIQPRRGNYVRKVSADAIVDLFNVRIALAGYAARGMAAAPDAAHLAALRQRLDELRLMSRQTHADPCAFAGAYTRTVAGVARGSGNAMLVDLMRDLAHHTAWTLVWRHALDFDTPARRAEICAQLEAAVRAIEAGDGAAAELRLRRVLEQTRDRALGRLARMRGETLDVRRLIHTDAAPRARDNNNDTTETKPHDLAGRNRRP